MDKFKIRASALGQIMTEPKLKRDKEAGKLSETGKQYMQEWMIAQRYKRKKIVSTTAMLKGTENELDSLAVLEKLHSLAVLEKLHGVKYWKNDGSLEDEYLTGTPDIITDDRVIDIKSSYDIFSFHKAESPVRPSGYTAYGWQLQAYMHLTGTKKATLAYVLTSSPEWVIEDEIRKTYFQMKIQTEEEQDYFDNEIAPRVRANHYFEAENGYPEVPLENRVITFDLEYDADAMMAVQDRVVQIRTKLENYGNEIW